MHSPVLPHAADGWIAQMMREPHRGGRASEAALLLSSGIGLLVRHASSGPAGRGGPLVRRG